MGPRRIVLTLCAAIIALFPLFAHAKKQKWEVTYPDGKKEVFQYDDSSCQMVGWQRKINFSANFSILKKYQGSGGFDLTSDHTRQLDNLETDFGLQFEALCKDYMMGVYKDNAALYDCRRGNVNNALTDLRQLSLLASTISSISDAATKKDSVATLLDKFTRDINDKCTKNALQIQTDSLAFGTQETEKSDFLTNVGYFDISWSATNVPRGFYVAPAGGGLPKTNSAAVVVLRLADPPAPAPRSFLIKDGQNDQVTVQLVISGDDAIQAMRQKIGTLLSNPTPGQDVVQNTASVVREFYKNTSDEVIYWVAGQLLNQVGDSSSAAQSFSKASQINPQLLDHPQFKLDVAKTSLLIGNVEGARKIIGEFLENQPVTTQKTYQLEKPEFYQQLYTQLGSASSAAALTNSLKSNGYSLQAVTK